MRPGGQPARSTVAALAALALLAACGATDDTEPTGEEPVASPSRRETPDRPRPTPHALPPHPRPLPQPVAPSDGPPAFLGGAETDDAWMARVSALPLVRLKPIGTTSVVFRATLAGDVDVAYRPRTRQSQRGWLAEVAAYRIARALRMDQVPPAVLHTCQRLEMRPKVDPDYRSAWSEFEDAFIGDGQGGVPGSYVLWVAGMQDVGLDDARHVEEWSRWLAHDGSVPQDRAALARDLSMLVAFDYLIGNFDRWSGGNVTVDTTGRRLVIRDHNLAFLTPLPQTQHDRVRATMQRAERLSRSFVTALRALDERHLRQALTEGTDASQAPLLTEPELAAVLERRQTLLSRVGALVDAYGAAAVLYFP